MDEILNFKKGGTIIIFNNAMTNFNVKGILTSHWRRNNMEYIHFNS
jgi:hypothetical protein